MNEKDLKGLHRLVQLYRMPTVLAALADMAQGKSLALRTKRDASKNEVGKRTYRKYAACWEDVARTLKRAGNRIVRTLDREDGNEKVDKG